MPNDLFSHVLGDQTTMWFGMVFDDTSRLSNVNVHFPARVTKQIRTRNGSIKQIHTRSACWVKKAAAYSLLGIQITSITLFIKGAQNCFQHSGGSKNRDSTQSQKANIPGVWRGIEERKCFELTSQQVSLHLSLFISTPPVFHIAAPCSNDLTRHQSPQLSHWWLNGRSVGASDRQLRLPSRTPVLL